MSETLQPIVEQVVSRLAALLAAASGQAVRPLPAVGSASVDWQVPLTITGPVNAVATLGMSAAAADRLAGLVETTAAGDAGAIDTLRELLVQATAACVSDATDGLSIVVGLPTRETAVPSGTAWQHDLLIDDDEPPRVAVWVASSSGTGVGASPVFEATRSASLPVPQAMAAAPVATVSAGGRNVDVVLDLELPITVRFGATRLTLDALSRLGPGSLIDLERLPDDPVDLLVNGRLVARGDVVVVAGCYGVRVRDVVSAADRLRSLEG